MTEEQKARAWPPATRGMVEVVAALLPAVALRVPLHFVRTRRSAARRRAGAGRAAAVYGASTVAFLVVAFLTGDT